MEVVRKVRVTDGGVPVPWLNELEVIEWEVWANIWQVRIIWILHRPQCCPYAA